MHLTRFIAPVALAACVATGPALADSFFVSSLPGSTTVEITPGTPYSWTFNASATYSNIEGGVFALKYAPGTTFGIRMQVEELITNSFMPGGTISLSAAAFNVLAGGNGDSQFTRIVFDITGSLALTPGDGYRVSLSVDGDPETNTGSYIMRGNFEENPFVVAFEPDEIVVASDTTPSPVSTPEPAAALLMAGALAGLATTRRVAQRASRA